MTKLVKWGMVALSLFLVSCHGTGNSPQNDTSAVNLDSMVNQAQSSVADTSTMDSTIQVLDSANAQIDSAVKN
ncbi:MAG: hypothetical protein ACYCOO_06150 [Chitinophagaceae bacterium]